MICGTKDNLQIHHIVPKNAPNNLKPIRGMDDPTNLLTLCGEHHGWIHGCKPNQWNNSKALQMEGIRRAQKAGKFTGRRPSIDTERIVRVLKEGNSISKTAEICGVSMSSVQRAKRKHGITGVTQKFYT